MRLEMMLTRKDKLLKLIVEDFIKTAEPVGSNYLIKKYDLPISSATIRNEMNALEKEGLLEKTHISSGRVPSTKGYEYYIEHLRNNKIDDKMKNELNKVFSNSITVEDIRYTNTRPDEDFTDPTELLYGYCSHQFLWFDLVLALPFDEVEGSSNYVSSNGRMSADGRYYDLVEADDYFALITVTVEWGENYGHSDMITIPLSGYYSRNEQADIDTTTSLYVDTLSSAANLNLATMAGQEIDVANVTFMSTSDSTNYSLFLSASRNPFYSDSNGFRFLHSSVSYGEVPTLEEYLGFNLYLTTTESTGGTSIGTVTSFTGEEAIEGTTLPDNAISIVPEKNTNTGSAEAYSQYSGRISLVMDSPQVTMKDGVYTEEVFIHIVTEESTTTGGA